MTLPGR